MNERQSEAAKGRGTTTRKHICLRRAIGGASVLFGVWLTWEIVHPVVRRMIVEENWESARLSFLSVLPLMLLPGILLIVSGVRLYKAVTISSLKWAFGLVATFGALWGSSELSRLFPGILPERIETAAFTLLCSSVAMFAYFAALWFTLPHFHVTRPHPATLVGRAGLMLIALQIWLLLFGLFKEYSPRKEGYTHVPREPWGILGVVVPIFAAYGAYRTATRLLHKTQQTGESSATASEAPLRNAST